MDGVGKRGRRNRSVAVVKDVVQKIERRHMRPEGRGDDDAEFFPGDILDPAVCKRVRSRKHGHLAHCIGTPDFFEQRLVRARC